MQSTPPLVLTFSATDPTAGAGLQADLLAISVLGGHSVNGVTGLTAQNTLGVQRFEPCAADWVNDQLESLGEDGVSPKAIKAGVLGSKAAVDAVLRAKRLWPNAALVLDPVRASGRGDAFAQSELFDYMLGELFGMFDLLTPNWPEALAFSGLAENSSVNEVVRALLAMGCQTVLVKGEHLPSSQVVNRLFEANGKVTAYTCERLPGQYHGSGCTLASACAAGLAHGLSHANAVAAALDFTWRTLQQGFVLGQGQLIPRRFEGTQPFEGVTG